MGSAVYVPFAASLAVAVLSRLASRRLWPRAAAWAMAAAGVLLAASTVGALVLLASPLAAQVPLVATLGRWQPRAIAAHTPVPAWVSFAALGVLVVGTARFLRELRSLAAEWRLAARPPGGGVLQGDVPAAYALANGTIVVSASIFGLLDRDERGAVIAHEWSHIRRRHARFLVLARLAAAADPAFVGLPAQMRYALERWADEDAARSAGRPVVASALTKVALAVIERAGLAATPGLAFHRVGVAERVAALLDEPNRRSRPAWVIVALAAAAAVALSWATHNTERFFEAARLWSR